MASILSPSPVTWSRPLPLRAIGVAERVAALLLAILLLPLILGCAILVRILSGRSPWIAHRRVGWQGSTLWMLKLRTMWSPSPAQGAGGLVEYIDDDSGPANKRPSDPRVSNAFARFCRRHSLDELPQLWHVIRGDMSFVGPRPLTASELRRHYGILAAEVLSVKPGIAGLWQISGRNRLSYAERRALDLKLVRQFDFGVYLRVLTGAVREVFSSRNTW
jgi:exopolysaccharide production protein ExoY